MARVTISSTHEHEAEDDTRDDDGDVVEARDGRREECDERRREHGVAEHSTCSYQLSQPPSRQLRAHVTPEEAADYHVLLLGVPVEPQSMVHL